MVIHGTKTIWPTQLTGQQVNVPIYTMSPDFLRVFQQKIPHIIVQMVVEGRLSHSMYIDVRLNTQII